MQKNGKKRSHSGSSSKRQPKRAALDKLQSNLPPVEGRTGVAVRKSSRGGWTDEEDEVLRRAVALHGAKNWKRIAEYFDGRTDVQCLHRWQKVLNPDLKKEPWSKEEDDTIIGLVGQYGTKRWTAIAEHLPGRIGKQCRERWHNHLNPDIKRGEWGREEDVVIVRMHRRFGNQWARMSSVLKGRTDNAIKNHWNSTLRRKAQQGDFDHLPDWNEGDSDAEDYGSGYDDGMSQEFISQDPSACTAASPKGRGGSQGLSASPTRRHMRPAPHSGSTVEEAESGEEPSPEAKDYALAGGPPPEGATRRSARVARRAAWAGGPLVVPDGDALAGLQSPRRGLSLEPGRSRTHAVLASPIARPSAALPLSPPLFKLPAAAAAAARGPPASWGAAASAAAGPAAAAGAAADSAAQHQQTISPPGHEPTLLPPVLPLSASGASTYQQPSLPTATTVPAAAAPGVGIGAAGPPSFTPLVETLAGSSPSLQSGPPSRTPFSTSSGGTSQGLLSPGSAAIAAGGLELAAELSGGSGGRRGSLGRVAMTLPGDLPANSGGDAGGPSAAEQQLQHQQPGEVVAALPPGPARLSDAGMLRLCQAVRGANLPVPGGAGGARFGAEHAASQSVATRLRPAGISSAPAVALLGPATASGPSIAAGPGEATATHAAVGGAVTHGAAGTAQKPASAAMHADTWSSLVELGINPSPAHGHLLTQTDTPLYLESARILQAAGSTIETPLMLSLMTGSKVGGSAGVPGSVRTGSMRRPQAELSILQPTGSSVLHAVPEAGPGGAPGSVSMAPSRHSRGAGGCGSSPWTDQQHPSGGSAGTLGVRSHAPSSATPLDGGSGLEGVSPPPATVGGSCRGRRAALGGLSFLLRSPSFLPPNTLLGLQPLSTCPPPGSTEAGTAGIAGAGAVLSGLASHNKARLGSGGGIPPPPRWGEAHDGGRQLAADPQGIAGGAQHPVRPLSSRLSDMFQRLESLDGGQQGQLVPSVLLYAQQPPVEQAAAMRQTKADAAPSKKPSPPPTAAALKAALLQIAMASPQNLDPNPQAGLGGWEGRGVLAGCSGHHLAGLDAEGVISVLDFGGLGTKSGKLRFGAGGPCATPMWHDVLGSEMGAANIAEFLQSEVATASSSKDALGIIQKALNDAASLYAAAEQVARASGFGVVGS